MTVYRSECGTHRGLMRHQNSGEAPCGICREGELRRRLESERGSSLPSRFVSPSSDEPLPEITEAQASANRAELARAIGAVDKPSYPQDPHRETSGVDTPMRHNPDVSDGRRSRR